jgi:hypothetical protein
MRRVPLAAALALVVTSSAIGQDRQPNSLPGPPPASPSPPAPDLKVAAIPPTAARSLTEADVEAIVERVIARQAVRGSALPPEGWQPPAVAPSSQYQVPVSMPYPSAQSYGRPAPQAVAVLVPAGPIASAIGRMGDRLGSIGRPRVRTYRVATATSAICPPATAYASGQAP